MGVPHWGTRVPHLGHYGALSQGIFLEFSSKEGVEGDFEELRAKKKVWREFFYEAPHPTLTLDSAA